MLWILMEHCGDCDKPSRQFDICSVLGHNPGIDGHLFETEQKAIDAMALFDAALAHKYPAAVTDEKYEGAFTCAQRGVKPYALMHSKE